MLIGLEGCSSKTEASGGGTAADAVSVGQDGSIRMSAEAARNAGVALAPTKAAQTYPLATIPGTIEPPMGARQAVTAPFPGVVRDVRVVPGAQVVQGQVLATVVSPDVLQSQGDLARARAQLAVARSAANRTRQLADAGVIARSRAEEANASLREAQAGVTTSSHMLGIAHANGNSGTYSLVAPIAGRIASMSITVGQSVDTSSAPFIVDASREYALHLQVPQAFAQKVRKGQTVRLEDGTLGTIHAVGTAIDPMTRAITAAAGVPAAPDVIAGKAVSATIMAQAPKGAVSIPTAAVTNVHGKTVVYERTASGFSPHPVTLIGRGGDRAVIVGIPVGRDVVVSGVAELKSAGAGE